MHKVFQLLDEDLLLPIHVLRHMQRLIAPETAGALIHGAAKVRHANSRASFGEEGMHPQEWEQFSWQQIFSDPTQCRARRRKKPNLGHPQFGHKVGQWSQNRHRPAWVDSTLPRLRGRKDHLDIEMCRKLCEDGLLAHAVDKLNHLVQRRCHVDNNIYYLALKRCIAQKDLVLGRHIHALTLKSGYEGDPFLATHLIGLYASHGRLEEAMRVFAKVSTPDTYNWATIIFAYARHGDAAEAIRLYRHMRESTNVNPSDHVYVAVLKACATAGDFVAGKEVHAHILASRTRPAIFVQTGLVNMYSKCGSLEDARKVFDKLPKTDVVTWTSMIAGYAQQGMGQEALQLYKCMQQEGLAPPDSVACICLLQACATVGVGALDDGKQLHAQIVLRGLQDDVILGGSLVHMYAKCGSYKDACSVFDRLPAKNVVAWTVMIAACVQRGLSEEALGLYDSLQQESLILPSPDILVCLLQACVSIGVRALHQGKQLHAEIEARGLQDDAVVGGTVVNMYARCGSLEDARRVFDRLPHRDVVTWTLMLAAYAHQGMGQKALSLYSSMQQEGITTPDSVTFVSVLEACAIVAALPLGRQVHAQIEEQGLQADLVVGTALVNMYAKCGSMFDSHQVFNSLPETTIEAWNALIGGYSRQGASDVVFDLLNRMKLDGIQPDGVTFISVLTVCSHVGLVDRGRECFEIMRTEYGIIATVEHYTCIMDLLGRAGHLDEALQIASTMPIPPNGVVWLALLGACRKWRNVEIGQQAFEAAVSLDGKDASPYVLMSSIYASTEMWEEAKEMQARRLKSAAWKMAGQSWWTDMDGVMHKFLVGD